MNAAVNTFKELIEKFDPNGNYDLKTWLDAIQNAYNSLEDDRNRAERYDEWDDDAMNFSWPGTDHVFVMVTSYDKPERGSQTIFHHTDFTLTPEEARSMFRGIRDNYQGE